MIEALTTELEKLFRDSGVLLVMGQDEDYSFRPGAIWFSYKGFP